MKCNEHTRLSDFQEDRPIPDAEMDGMSLAEELSAFLYESPSPDNSGSQSESSSSSPERAPPTTNKSRDFASQVPSKRKPGQTAAPKPSSGLNPVYALTQTAPEVPPQSLPAQSLPGSSLKQSPQTSQQPLRSQTLAPGVIPSRALKPVTSLNGSGFLAPAEQSPNRAMNGFHGGGVILEPTRPNEFVRVEGRKGDGPELVREVSRPSVQNNGTPECRFVCFPRSCLRKFG